MRKKTYEEVKNLFTQHGYELLETEYKDNKQKLEYKCKCGNICRVSVHKIGSRIPCKNCGLEKRKENAMEKYGVDNIAQLDSVKKKKMDTLVKRFGPNPFRCAAILQKKRETFLKKYGVNHPMHSETVKKKLQKTCMEKYGTEHAMKNEKVKKKQIQTCREKYGVDYVSQSDRYKNTCQERYGVKNPLQNEEIKQKVVQTCLERHGVSNPLKKEEFKQKMAKTCREKYGSNCCLQNEEVKKKCRQTCREKYGVPFVGQNREIHQKILRSSFRTKTYTFPSGTAVEVQGYEPFCLNELLSSQECTEEDLLQGYERMPTIPYMFEGQKHYYHPDIFIPSSNRIIEVKSDYTLEKEYDKNMAKLSACKNFGFCPEIRSYDYKGNISYLIY